MPSFNNVNDEGIKNGDAKNNNNNKHTSNNSNSTSSGGSGGTGSRHLQIIYISLKEKYNSKDEDAEDTQEESQSGHVERHHESGKNKNETHFKRNKKPSAAQLSSAEQLTNSAEGEYFELMETIQQENGSADHCLVNDAHEDTGLKFKLG